MGKYTTLVGFCTFGMMFARSNVMKLLGWIHDGATVGSLLGFTVGYIVGMVLEASLG